MDELTARDISTGWCRHILRWCKIIAAKLPGVERSFFLVRNLSRKWEENLPQPHDDFFFCLDKGIRPCRPCKQKITKMSICTYLGLRRYLGKQGSRSVRVVRMACSKAVRISIHPFIPDWVRFPPHLSNYLWRSITLKMAGHQPDYIKCSVDAWINVTVPITSILVKEISKCLLLR